MPNIATVRSNSPGRNPTIATKLLQETMEKNSKTSMLPPKQKLSDLQVLLDYQNRKRKEFENNIRKNRMVVSSWTEYARWEEKQKFISRARLIYERALDVDHHNITLWIKYIEMEIRSRQINHARNLWDRVVTVLPRVNQFWYKYTEMEEKLENIAEARQVFERWMKLEPEDRAWQTYINFEIRHKQIDRARDIYERLVILHPDARNWIKFARFEAAYGHIKQSRRIYERAVGIYDHDLIDEKLCIAFAKFEEGQREHKRARIIYEYGMAHIPKEKTEELYKAYSMHKKKYGNQLGIKDVIINKKKYKFEQLVKKDPYNYITWFDYLDLVESENNHEAIRQVYERAVTYVPSKDDINSWREYIYLWINYAVFEEIETKEIKRCRQIYKLCLGLIPHEMIIFTKVWLYYAEFEVRQKNLSLAREALGRSLGIFPKKKLSRKYMQMKMQFDKYDEDKKMNGNLLEDNQDLQRKAGDGFDLAQNRRQKKISQ